MAEEVLVKEVLTEESIAAGETLLKRLEKAGIDVIAAYWIYSPSVGEWYLEFVTPLMEEDGPVEFYGKTYHLASASPKIHLPLNMIMGLGPHYRFYRLLREAINPKKDLSGVRLNHYVIGDEVVDLYIYRLPANE